MAGSFALLNAWNPYSVQMDCFIEFKCLAYLSWVRARALAPKKDYPGDPIGTRPETAFAREC